MGTRRIADDAQGRPRWVRQPYNAAELTVPADFIPALRADSKGRSSIDLLAEHDGPFVAFMRRGTVQRDGKAFAVLQNPNEWIVEVEVGPGELGEIRVVPPEEAWRLVREFDSHNPTPIPVEGQDVGRS